MRFEEVAAEVDLVGLAITEYMLWRTIELSHPLRSLLLLGNG